MITNHNELNQEQLEAYDAVDSMSDDGNRFQARKCASLAFAFAVDEARQLRAWQPGVLRAIVYSARKDGRLPRHLYEVCP